MTIATNFQGSFIVERNEGGDLLIMLPDGAVVVAGDKDEAQRKIRAWCKRHAVEAFNFARVEWRDGTHS